MTDRSSVVEAAERRDFASLAVGDELPALTVGPLSTAHLVRWSAAIENWHRIHYDVPFATEHDGLPGVLINGSWKQHFVIQMLRGWVEPDGWVLRVAFQFRRMDVAGSTLTAWARITDLSERDGLGYVDLELGVRNEHGQESTPGTATLVMPASQGHVVPYPFPRP